MSRPARPTRLKVLSGERHDRINYNEPIPGESTVTPCMPLSEVAQKVWDRLAPDLLDKHVLTAWDVDMFVLFCDTVAIYHECRTLMGNDYLTPGSVDNLRPSPYWRIMRDCAETMARVGGRFGLTPADRAGINVSDETPRYGAERILD